MRPAAAGPKGLIGLVVSLRGMSSGRYCCDLHCGKKAGRQRCCGKRLCEACFTNLLKPRFCKDSWHTTCPFCRARARVTRKRVKTLMRSHCPSHACVLETEDVGPAAIVHMPGTDGHYTAQTSSVEIVPLDMPVVLASVVCDMQRMEANMSELLREQAAVRRQHAQVLQENHRLTVGAQAV